MGAADSSEAEGVAPRTSTLGVVVSCHNEERNVRELAQRLFAACEGEEFRLRLLFVEDGSTDRTLAQVLELARTHPDIGVVSLSRNFGKESAMLAGLSTVAGDAVVLMDADLQHPPELVPKMWRQWLDTGSDQVIARRDRAGDPLMRSVAARTFYRLVNRAIEVDLVDGEGDFRLMSRRAVDALLELSEANRFSKGLYAWIGYDRTIIDYGNRGRGSGSSSWTLRDLVNYGTDAVFSFNSRPLRTVIHAGWITCALSVAYLLWVVVATWRGGVETAGYVTTFAAITFLGGVQLISLGVIGEYVGRIYLEVKRRPHYLIRERSIPSEWGRPGAAPAQEAEGCTEEHPSAGVCRCASRGEHGAGRG